MSPYTTSKPDVPGATYRQLDYWARLGLLRPRQDYDGSGHARSWPAEEIRVARIMARLVRAGLAIEAAHRAARGETEIAPGVWVLVDLLEAPGRAEQAVRNG